MKEYIKIHENDNVAVALKPLKKGATVNVGNISITLSDDIEQGHKFALCDIENGDYVIKYANPIGTATKDIKEGAWVHTHNLRTNLDKTVTYTYTPKNETLSSTEERFFEGFRRKDGKVGVRNEIWIIPTVGCVNDVVSAVEKQSQKFISGSIDCITAFRHPYGCSQMGDDQENTRKILSNLINHPNAAGVLVIGLGCENSNIDVLKKYIGNYDENRVKFLECQQSDDEIADALELIKELCAYAESFKREKISCKELIVGLKCGGSDGLSGITANPTVGAFSDLLISKGGTTILTEVPEMFGAEILLMNRCENEKVFDDTVKLVNDFKEYFLSNGQTVYENPSPGNKKGGISTLEDKSLGCTQKSGSAAVTDVLKYGDTVKKRGLNLLSAPGNDLVAATALAASGAHIVLFTTGRGTPFASPVPTVKISSNSQLASKKNNWIDFDCGVIIEEISAEKLGEKLFAFVIETASGKYVKSELSGYHDMAIFKQGVTL